MPLLINQPMLGDINTISIPTDAIFTICLLIVFLLIGYVFNNILRNNTNQYAKERNTDSKLKLFKEELEGQFELGGTKLDQTNIEEPRSKKQNFIGRAKFLGLSSLAVVSMGGASLIGIQNIQKSYEGLNTSLKNIKLENQSTNKQLSMSGLNSINTMEKNIKKVGNINPFLSTLKRTRGHNYYQIKEKQIENIFYF